MAFDPPWRTSGAHSRFRENLMPDCRTTPPLCPLPPRLFRPVGRNSFRRRGYGRIACMRPVEGMGVGGPRLGSVAGRELRVAPRQFRQLRPPPLAIFALGQNPELVGIIAIMRRPFRERPRIGPAMRASALPR